MKDFYIWLKQKFSSASSYFKGKSPIAKVGIVLAAVFGTIASLILIFYSAILMGYYGKLPTRATLKNFQNNTASEVYAADGELIGRYYIQDRTNVSYADISPYMIDALIVTEDVRFYNHNGVDYKSLMRVLIKSLLLQEESSGGGSTLSQQLAKNLYPRKNYGRLSMVVNKIKEAVTATRLERVYTKKEILTLYLNTVSYGENTFGIERAASRFFSKRSKDLTLEESAVLVGLLKANTYYSPRLYPERATQRRNTVFNQMVKYGKLEASRADSLKEIPLKLKYQVLDHNDGLATYFREHLRQQLQAWCSQKKKPGGGNYNLYTDGLKIYTTLDSRMQRYAEEAMRQHMKKLQASFFAHWKNRRPWEKAPKALENAVINSKRYVKLKKQGLTSEEIKAEFSVPAKTKVFTWDGEQTKTMTAFDSVKYYLHFLNAGLLSMDPHDGHIKAWVGGIDHAYFKYDHVNKSTKRQVGSVFKPIVYAAALQRGINPCKYISAERRIYESYENWSPGNADGVYEGEYSMEGALTKSVNTVSVDLILKTGISRVTKLARAMGIDSNIEAVPSIALGTPNISLFEMVGAYGTFANGGMHVKPTYLVRIEDKKGKVIQNFEKKSSRKRVLSKDNADMVVKMLEGVVDNGTAAKLRYQFKLKNDIAGKTGTTQSHADGWFMGITPSLVTGVWVGADDPRIHFRSLQLGQGSNTAMPIWGLYMQKVNKDPALKGIAQAQFPEPSSGVLSRLDCEPFRLEKPSQFMEFLQDLGIKKKEDRKSPTRVPRTKNPKKKKKGFFDKLKEVF